MKHLIALVTLICFVSFLALVGCSSSKQTTEQTETPPPPPTEVKPSTEIPPQAPVTADKKIDTLKVDVKDMQKPAYEEKEIPSPVISPIPTGKFSVQIGAYKMPDNADRIATLAKERFKLNIYTIIDRVDNLYKVMIGDFNTRDEARNFRDEMASKFPDDYKGAWVSENTKK